MSRQRAIWNEVTSCSYAKAPSWGGNNNVSQKTYVGTGSSNSELLAEIEVSKKIYENHVVFNFYLDGELVRQNIFKKKKDKAGEFLMRLKGDFMNSTNEKSFEL